MLSVLLDVVTLVSLTNTEDGASQSIRHPCELTSYPSAAAHLKWHACARPDLTPTASLDSQLAALLPLLDGSSKYKIGKSTRPRLLELLRAVRQWTGDAHLQAAGLDMLRCSLGSNSTSQHREDVALLPLMLHVTGGRPGTFVELGALDGLTMSNTHMLERCHGWTGLLIEGNPQNAEKLQGSYRTGTKVHSAVCEGKGTLRMTIDGNNQATMVGSSGAGMDGRAKADNETVEVPCSSLRHLMHAAGLRDGADYLSLDVEGAEELVLSTVNPALFRVVQVENTGSCRRSLTNCRAGMPLELREKNDRVRARLERAGLKYQMSLLGDDVYLRNDTSYSPVDSSLSASASAPAGAPERRLGPRAERAGETDEGNR